MAPTLPLHTDMSGKRRGPNGPAPEAITHQFTVLRGMTAALVIETQHWYAGLLQAALARVRSEGQN